MAAAEHKDGSGRSSSVVKSSELTSEATQFWLQSQPFGLSTDDCKLVQPFVQLEEYPDDTYLFRTGTPSDKCYLVWSGRVVLVVADRHVSQFTQGQTVGEMGVMEQSVRRGHAKSVGVTRVLSLSCLSLLSSDFPRSALISMMAYLARRVTSLISGQDFYRATDVLIVQDGGCAPGYDTVTSYLTEYFEARDRQVFVARHGFRSLVSGLDTDFCALVHSRTLFSAISLVPRLVSAPELRYKRGASFRSERYPEFQDEKLQRTAAKVIEQRGVNTLVCIGGNGTFKGTRALARFLPKSIRVFFIPVTIDSDVSGTECIGQHTAVEIGAEHIRCFVADGETHHRCYILEMMGASGGYHALMSAMGGGAHLAVLPNTSLDLQRLAAQVQQRNTTVIVVAEGYAREERQRAHCQDPASTYLYKQLLATGALDKRKKVVCEPFTRAVRGCAPNNVDVILACRLAAHTVTLDTQGLSLLMPIVLSDRLGQAAFGDIETDNAVDPAMAALADVIGATKTTAQTPSHPQLQPQSQLQSQLQPQPQPQSQSQSQSLPSSQAQLQP